MDYMMKWRDINFKTKKEQNIDFELQQRNNICNEMISIKRTSTEWVKTKKKNLKLFKKQENIEWEDESIWTIYVESGRNNIKNYKWKTEKKNKKNIFWITTSIIRARVGQDVWYIKRSWLDHDASLVSALSYRTPP